MYRAVRNRRLATSTRLLELGADVSRCNDNGVTVRKDVVMYMDLLQQECIKRKLVELAQQPARMVSRAAKAGAGIHLSGTTSPDTDSPRAVGAPVHSGDAHMLCKLAASMNANELSDAKKTIYRRTPSHGSAVITPPRSPRVNTAAMAQVHGVSHAVSPRSPSATAQLLLQSSCVQAESSEADTHSGQNPRDCNPDDVSNLSSPHDQSCTPIRYACMQVDAWASNIPGVRWWHSATSWQSAKALRRRPVLFMLDRPTEVSENIQWRVNSTLVECRAVREAALRRIHRFTKVVGQVSSEVATVYMNTYIRM